MAYFAVWMDHDHAKIFKFLPEKVEKTEIKRHPHHHNPAHAQNEKNDSVHQFYKDLAKHLDAAKEIYLLGAGVAKNEFKSYLEKHHLERISKHIVGLESMDKSTDGEIEKKARAFFTHRNVFN